MFIENNEGHMFYHKINEIYEPHNNRIDNNFGKTKIEITKPGIKKAESNKTTTTKEKLAKSEDYQFEIVYGEENRTTKVIENAYSRKEVDDITRQDKVEQKMPKNGTIQDWYNNIMNNPKLPKAYKDAIEEYIKNNCENLDEFLGMVIQYSEPIRDDDKNKEGIQININSVKANHTYCIPFTINNGKISIDYKKKPTPEPEGKYGPDIKEIKMLYSQVKGKDNTYMVFEVTFKNGKRATVAFKNTPDGGTWFIRKREDFIPSSDKYDLDATGQYEEDDRSDKSFEFDPYSIDSKLNKSGATPAFLAANEADNANKLGGQTLIEACLKCYEEITSQKREVPIGQGRNIELSWQETTIGKQTNTSGKEFEGTAPRPEEHYQIKLDGKTYSIQSGEYKWTELGDQTLIPCKDLALISLNFISHTLLKKISNDVYLKDMNGLSKKIFEEAKTAQGTTYYRIREDLAKSLKKLADIGKQLDKAPLNSAERIELSNKYESLKQKIGTELGFMNNDGSFSSSAAKAQFSFLVTCGKVMSDNDQWTSKIPADKKDAVRTEIAAFRVEKNLVRASQKEETKTLLSQTERNMRNYLTDKQFASLDTNQKAGKKLFAERKEREKNKAQ